MRDDYIRMLETATNLIAKEGGMQLDMGCGQNKQPGFVGLDVRPLEGVDIVWDLEELPYPIPDESCIIIMGSHIIEHISPKVFIPLMDELWRILKPGRQLAFSYPYGGSPGYWQDPTHVNGCNQRTWQYFDPSKPLYQIYRPFPWAIEVNSWQQSGNGEVVLRKMSVDEGLAAEGATDVPS